MYQYRAYCTHVVDGDTVDLVVDIGFHLTTKQRFRLVGIDTPELHDHDPAQRTAAQKAKQVVIDLLHPSDDPSGWPLEVYSYKTGHFGRWLGEITFRLPDGTRKNIGEYLLEHNLATLYER